MFKFKMSLLLNNLKFRVAMVVLIIAAILVGIVYIPKNKAGNISQQANIKAVETGIAINGRQIYSISIDGKFEGYNKIFCIEEDAALSYKTYSNPIEIANATEYFTNYNSAKWILANMYVTNVSGQNGMSKEVAKDIHAMYFANLLTAPSVKDSVKSKVGVDYSSVTPEKIFNLRNKTIGTAAKVNAIEMVEQIALWKYTKNTGTTVSSAYGNPTQYIPTSELTEDEQITLKYIYYALINLADSNASKSPNMVSKNITTLVKENAKFDASTYKVGPYYIAANGVKLSSYNFGDTTKGNYFAKATITNIDGTVVDVINDVFVKNEDGSFYVDLSNYKNAKSVKVSIGNVFSSISANAHVLDGKDNQNLVTVEKSIGMGSITDEKEISIPGNYTIVLNKVKKDGTTIITSSEATFKVNGKEFNTKQGVLNIAQNKSIENTNQVDTYEIIETKAPNGYNAFKGTLKVSVKFKQEGNKYVIDRENTIAEGFENGTKMEISADNSTINVFVPNEEQPGKFSVELYKVDEKGNIIKTPAKFDVNGKEAETKDGKIVIASNVEVKDDTTVNTYTIKETLAPENYYLCNDTITLKVKMTKVNDVYVLTQEGVKFSTDNENSKVTYKVEGSTVKVYVPNTLKPFDLALRKYISKINGVVVEPSREPVINKQSIIMLEKTGTASYYHAKNSIGVRVGDEIEYTIRVYNEGEILGFAKQITDYLPEGLSFVRLSEDNSKEFTTTSEAGSKVVVINYSGNTLIKSLRDFIGKEVKVTNEYYQQVKIICKVENSEQVYITNRGEITNYGYNQKDENGNIIWKEATQVGNVDLDSVQNTIKGELNLNTWYENAEENTYVDENGNKVVDKNYYPGSQDDDDFETVEVLTGKYNVIIKKVDSANTDKVLSGAHFVIKGSNIENELKVGPTGSNGEVTAVKGISIKNEQQVDTYTIKETIAPQDYNLYAGDITLKIKTKFNGTNFVIDEKNTTVNGKNVKMSVNKDNTCVTIIVPNEKKEFDLSLRKFITEVNGKELAESRAPQVDVSKLISGESTTATYNHPKNTVDVNTSDIVTYTIRVYNEGEMNGYASKVMDDVPEGLLFIPATFDENGKPTNINAQYKWTLYKEATSSDKIDSLNSIKYGNKTYVITDIVEEADVIVTDYLSKENGENNLIKAFDSKTMKTLDYKDVKVSFRVIEPTKSDRVLINYAQITESTDSQGKPTNPEGNKPNGNNNNSSTPDRDSIPNVWNEGEDDQDIEKVKVRYFDLSLLKWVTKAIVYENGIETITETGHTGYENPEPIVKVDLKNTSLNNVEVKFEYKIRITNEGQIAGYAKEISDYIPEGLKFIPADNPEWKEVEGKIVTRQLENTLLQPGETADVTVILTWINGENNLGLKVNTAEISEDYNEFGTPDIDSTPNNKVPGEDDIDDAPIMLAIRTGRPIVYTGLAVGVLSIISLGAVVIRKKVL